LTRSSPKYLRLPYIREQYETLAKEAAELGWSHIEYLERLIEGEAHLREDRRIQRRIRLARFSVIKTLGHTACLQGYSVLFTTAIDAINTLAAAHSAGRLKSELNKYLKPRLLILDELGYLPIDKKGADLLFQIISGAL